MAEIGRFEKLAYTLWPANKVQVREELRPEQRQQGRQQQESQQQEKEDDEPGHNIDEYV